MEPTVIGVVLVLLALKVFSEQQVYLCSGWEGLLAVPVATSGSTGIPKSERVLQSSPVSVDSRWRCSKRSIQAMAVLGTAALLVSGCILFYPGEKQSDYETLTLFGFSVKGEVFESKIIPGFRSHWKERTGMDVGFKTTYAGSGRITNQAISGSDVEVLVLSTEWDALRLEKEGLTDGRWRDLPHSGTISCSPFVIITRAGNPLGIMDFSDLTEDGVELIHADPLTSGGACWSIFAVYGSALATDIAEGREPDHQAARELLGGVTGNVISWQSSARNALSQFELGYGDALITYENEALLAISQGKDYDIIYPRSTILSEHKVVVVDTNVCDGERELVDSFVDYLFTPSSQNSFVDFHFRSPDDQTDGPLDDGSTVQVPFTVDMLGGWEKAHSDIIEGVFRDVK